MAEFQREFFTELGEGKKRKRHHSILIPKKYIKLEQSQFILLLSLFLIGILFSYIWGYKKAIHSFKENKNISFVKQVPVKKVRDEIREKKKIIPKSIYRYQIQVVTYRNEKYAKEEIKKLKKLGFNSYLQKEGKFVIVYVGKINTKEEAKQILKKLKKWYKDAFIKKVKEEKNESTSQS